MTSLSVSHLTVNFGSRTVISDLSFELRQGEIASLLGPSGCGKTTLLRAIADAIGLIIGTMAQRVHGISQGLLRLRIQGHELQAEYAKTVAQRERGPFADAIQDHVLVRHAAHRPGH